MEIDENGTKAERAEEEDGDGVQYEAIPLEEGDQKVVKVRTSPVTDIRVTHRDLDKYGCTPGCPACEYVLKDQKIARGVAHSKECRQRIRENIEIDEETRERTNRADDRKKKHEQHVGSVGKVPKYRSKLEKEFNTKMLEMVAEGMDVAEIYSPPRIAERARKWGLRGGWSMDLTTTDENGKKWDFSKKEMREKAINKIKKDRPLLIVGSPMCIEWSSMMNMNWPKMTEEVRAQRMKEARKHI